MLVLHYRERGMGIRSEHNNRATRCKLGMGMTLAFIGLTLCFYFLVAGVVCVSCAVIILAIPEHYLPSICTGDSQASASTSIPQVKPGTPMQTQKVPPSMAKAAPPSPIPLPIRRLIPEIRLPTDHPPPTGVQLPSSIIPNNNDLCLNTHVSPEECDDDEGGMHHDVDKLH